MYVRISIGGRANELNDEDANTMNDIITANTAAVKLGKNWTNIETI